jgi:uncharacterized RDD family membrane protein YckC
MNNGRRAMDESTEYAGFFRRFFAGLIDFTILITTCVLLYNAIDVVFDEIYKSNKTKIAKIEGQNADADSDIDSMSFEQLQAELAKIEGQKPVNEKKSMSDEQPEIDYTKLSDEELARMAGDEQPAKPTLTEERKAELLQRYAPHIAEKQAFNRQQTKDVILFIFVMLYFSLLQSFKSASLGKMAFGITVLNENGTRISFGKSIYYTLCGLLFAIGTFFTAFLPVLFNKNKQALHDRVCKVVLVCNP